MPPRKRLRWKQPAPSGSGQPPANCSRGSTGDGHSAVGSQCEEGHAEPNSGGGHSAVTKRMAHASCGDRLQPKRPSQEEHAHMPPRKRMRWKQPAPSGSGQPPANSSRGSTQLGGHIMSYQWGPMREPTGQFEVVASCGNDLLHGARGRVTGGVGCVSGEFSPPAHRPHAASAHARCRDAPIHSKLRAFAATSIHIDIGSGKYILQWR